MNKVLSNTNTYLGPKLFKITHSINKRIVIILFVLPAVLALQRKREDKEAICFSLCFYSMLFTKSFQPWLKNAADQVHINANTKNQQRLSLRAQ